MGGALGALLRYGVSAGVYAVVGRGFPYGTLAVNVLGSWLMGFFTVVLLERLTVGPEWRGALLIGFFGAFTTFSTFSMETLFLIEQGSVFKALLNMVISVLFCVGAAWVGLNVGRTL